MKRDKIIQLRVSESELNILDAVVREMQRDVDVSINRSDVLRILLRDKYSEYVSSGIIKPEDIIGGGYGLFV